MYYDQSIQIGFSKSFPFLPSVLLLGWGDFIFCKGFSLIFYKGTYYCYCYYYYLIGGFWLLKAF